MNRIVLPIAAVCLAVQCAPALAFDWNGFYAGVSAGYASGTGEGAYDDPDLAPFDISNAPTGWLLGAQVGVNQSMGGVVVGLEGDLSLSDVTDTIDDELGNFLGHDFGPHSITSTTDFSGTLRGRLGFDAGDFLPYLTAGLAVVHVTVDATDGPLTTDATLSGWTAGGGVEFAVADNVTVKVEGLFTDLGEHTWFEGMPYSSTVHSTSTTVRAGVNFAFD